MKVVLRPGAVADVRAARDYYEDARPGLADRLVEDPGRLFARLEAFPRSAPPVEGYEQVRRATLRRFPFVVFYQLSTDERIDVLRIVHTARSRDTWPEGDE